MWFMLLGSVESEGEFMPRWRAYAMVEGEFVLCKTFPRARNGKMRVLFKFK